MLSAMSLRALSRGGCIPHGASVEDDDFPVKAVYYTGDMPDAEHIYSPKDDSLFQRISAYRSVRAAYMNAQAGLQYLDDDVWAERLGGRENTEQAFAISARSLKKATDALDQEEVKQAIAEGWFTVDEAREFMQLKRQAEMQSIREGHTQSSSHKHTRRPH